MGLKFHPPSQGLVLAISLKSDQNGIEMVRTWTRSHPSYSLKSDQNGIEMFFPVFCFFHQNQLKSDQNGIEIRWSRSGGGVQEPVKIRPKWDWNHRNIVELWMEIGLKSDQNGIEMKHHENPIVLGKS